MENDPKPYKFMKESIKKQPPDWKKIVLLIAGWLALAALGGLVAAAVFAVTEPKIAEAVTREEPPAKVDIPGDEDPNSGQEPDETITASSASASVDSSGSGSEISSSTVDSSTSESSVSESTVSESTEENGAAEGTESSLKNYEALYQDMLGVTEKPKRALVTVIGITNQMDYFNQNYENQQQISGLIVADNGQDLFILTEYRIVENVERIQVTFWDETMVDATYQRHDPSTGLTIVKVDESKLDEGTRDGLVVAPLGSSYLVSQGDPVVAVGSPVGYSDSIAYGVVTSVTNKISALDNEYNLLTTDILGSTDGSGILVNLDGEIVGIIAQSYSAKGNNVVTGIAISQIKKLIENLSNNVSRAYIGIRGQDVTEELSDKTGIPKGVLISRVADDSPAMMAGMKEYDVIVKLGEHKVETIKQYHEQLGKYSTGDVVTVTAMRKGAEGYAEMTFDVTIGEV
ncbi:S1C family serine protease [Fusicatenibacter sp.]